MLGGEPRIQALSSTFRNRLAARLVAQQVEEVFSERFLITRWNEHSVVVIENLGNSADARCQHRNLIGHCFENSVWQSLTDRRQNQHVHSLIIGAYIIAIPCEYDVFG